VSVEFLGSQSSLNGESLLQRYEGDTFALLNVALAPGTTVIRVEAGVDVADPIVVLNESPLAPPFLARRSCRSRCECHGGRIF